MGPAAGSAARRRRASATASCRRSRPSSRRAAERRRALRAVADVPRARCWSTRSKSCSRSGSRQRGRRARRRLRAMAAFLAALPTPTATSPVRRQRLRHDAAPGRDWGGGRARAQRGRIRRRSRRGTRWPRAPPVDAAGAGTRRAATATRATRGPATFDLASSGLLLGTADGRGRLLIRTPARRLRHSPLHAHADLFGVEADVDGSCACSSTAASRIPRRRWRAFSAAPARTAPSGRRRRAERVLGQLPRRRAGAGGRGGPPRPRRSRVDRAHDGYERLVEPDPPRGRSPSSRGGLADLDVFDGAGVHRWDTLHAIQTPRSSQLDADTVTARARRRALRVMAVGPAGAREVPPAPLDSAARLVCSGLGAACRPPSGAVGGGTAPASFGWLPGLSRCRGRRCGDLGRLGLSPWANAEIPCPAHTVKLLLRSRPRRATTTAS